MATEKWVAGSGQGLTWGSAFGSEVNSLSATNNAVLSSVSIVNGGSTLDLFADLSYVAGGTVTTTAPAFLQFFLYPLNEDGSTYGDGRFGSAAAGPPPSNYSVGSFGFAIGAGTTIAGVITRIILPPGTFKFVIWNQAGVALDSAPIIKYRTYNRSVA